MELKRVQRNRRHRRIRSRIKGTPERPRLSIFRSNQHIWAQIIDDNSKVTLVSASDHGSKKKESLSKRASAVGKLLAERAREKKIEKIVFDRGGYKYHGAVKMLAEEARKEGLQF